MSLTPGDKSRKTSAQVNRVLILTLYIQIDIAQCHEIFDFMIFSWNIFPWAPIIHCKPFSAISIFLKIRKNICNSGRPRVYLTAWEKYNGFFVLSVSIYSVLILLSLMTNGNRCHCNICKFRERRDRRNGIIFAADFNDTGANSLPGLTPAVHFELRISLPRIFEKYLKWRLTDNLGHVGRWFMLTPEVKNLVTMSLSAKILHFWALDRQYRICFYKEETSEEIQF